METKAYQIFKFILWLYILFAGITGVYMVSSYIYRTKVEPMKSSVTGTVTGKDFIPPHWFTHVIEDNKGKRIVQDFQPALWFEDIKLSNGKPYRCLVEQTVYDTLKLNQLWTKKN